MDTAAKLFGSQTTARLMRWFLFHPSESATASVLREKTKSAAEQLRKSLRLLQSAGFIKKRGSRFLLNGDFPNLKALKEFLIDNLLLVINVSARLRPAGTLKLISAAGVFIGDEESRTDLLVVGDKMNLSKLQKLVTLLEADIGTEIRYTALSSEEFKYRMGFNDKLVRDILDYPHEILLDKIPGAEK